MASFATRQIRSRDQHDIVMDEIKATHFPMDDLYVTLPVQKAHQSSDVVPSSCSSEAEEQRPYMSRSIVLLDVHDMGIVNKIENYLHTTSVRGCELETSNFMNVTCNAVKLLILDKKVIY